MAKRQTNRPKVKDFRTAYPNSHNVADKRLMGSGRGKLSAIANRMLAKSGYFDRVIYTDSFGVDADMISGRSSLRPNWHGKA